MIKIRTIILKVKLSQILGDFLAKKLWILVFKKLVGTTPCSDTGPVLQIQLTSLHATVHTMEALEVIKDTNTVAYSDIYYYEHKVTIK